jgi:hypothetical protein
MIYIKRYRLGNVNKYTWGASNLVIYSLIDYLHLYEMEQCVYEWNDNYML